MIFRLIATNEASTSFLRYLFYAIGRKYMPKQLLVSIDYPQFKMLQLSIFQDGKIKICCFLQDKGERLEWQNLQIRQIFLTNKENKNLMKANQRKMISLFNLLSLRIKVIQQFSQYKHRILYLYIFRSAFVYSKQLIQNPAFIAFHQLNLHLKALKQKCLLK
ncbi:hypothetical protein TTHERM_000137779 (macronuclear) [Tetrahymena thermophila SB210]|uniref:UvrC family homology region profile domain-containing protein n=1 Tax=Tetrahymena thermophila (strain SB210) TaxID=312017 RepID=W7X816_TETTS|nr:hypothetical protein TTHERM_000137779 [Tetrahymena thermophila SB210]EWS73482.1 hypothetical protein TTHERM_000137779 [Tetrahymena thermophila SB210]|eukprot:XP_012653964.1 hypothetical protein TTHERM_000137779 [Tetrahymena thermophila SB210]